MKEVVFILCFVSILSKPILLSLMTCYLVSCIVVCFVCEAVSLFLKSLKYSHFVLYNTYYTTHFFDFKKKLHPFFFFFLFCLA